MNRLKELELKKIEIREEIERLEYIESIILEIISLAYEINNCNMTAYHIEKAEKLYKELTKSRLRDGKKSKKDVFRDSLFEGVLRRRDEIDKQIELEKQRGENEG